MLPLGILVDREYSHYQHIYTDTDDSNMDEKTGYAVVTPSVYTAELSAKLSKVRWAIFSDLLSSLQAIESMYPKSNPILTEIQDELDEIGEMKTVKFVCTPSHAGMCSNEKA
jgi:hypothetical protein